MQTTAHTPAHAQHVPDGWSFPMLSAAVPPAPVPRPVTGGGSAPSTVTRVRWGRVLPLLAGIALVAFGIWNMQGSATSASDRTVSGGGSGDVDITRSIGASDDASAADAAIGTTDSPSATDAVTPSATPVTPPTVTPARTTGTVRGGGTARAAAPRGSRAGRTTRRGVAAATPAFASGSASAATAPRTRTGGGAPAGQLPVTGLETWIAGILGVLLLAVGICVHVSAVRLATTAMLYRRGILLRPTECARLAQAHGLAQLRITLSDVLHRLLEEPAGGSDFVSARTAT